MKNKKIVVLMGGTSPERKVSLKSGENIYNSLKRSGYNVQKFIFDGNNINELISSNPAMVFNIIHGGEGENGRMAAFLDLYKIPYIGSKTEAQVITMAKHICQPLLKHYNFTVPEFVVITKRKEINNKLNRLFKDHKKVVVKASEQGSSIGVVMCDNIEKANKNSNKIFKNYGIVIVEEYIKGQEITCGIIEENKRTISFSLMEIRAKKKFYNYEAKYVKGATEFIVPAKVNNKTTKKIKSEAEAIFSLLDLKDFARIDCILKNGTVYWHDVNTIPGMTDLSDLPQVAVYDGVSYDELVEMILKNAVRRYEQKD